MITILPQTDKEPLNTIGYCAGVCWNSPVDDKEKNIEVSSISDENNKPEILWNKVMYYNERLNNFDTKVINKKTR